MAAPLPYLRLLSPLAWFIPLSALMGLSCLHLVFLDSGIFTCFILYASIYGIGPFVCSWALDYEYLWSRYSAYRLTVYTVCARVHIGKPDVFNKKNQPSAPI